MATMARGIGDILGPRGLEHRGLGWFNSLSLVSLNVRRVVEGTFSADRKEGLEDG